MADVTKVFAVPVFFVVFRESLETAIIISVLLVVLKQTLGPESDHTAYNKLVKQVWLGAGSAFAICIVVGCAMIGVFYRFGRNSFLAAENIWEGVLALFASVIISVIGAAMLRINKMQAKWRARISQAIEKKDGNVATKGRFAALKLWCERYAMFILPFVTVLREGLEAVVFIGGVGLNLPATSFPLAIFCGLLCGGLVAFLIYKIGNTAKMQMFLIVSTCFLYLVAAGLFSKGVWSLEAHRWSQLLGGDSDENFGNGPGSYDIRQSVWHVNCCSREGSNDGGGGWGVFNALFGWQNSATYGSVISYNLYWLMVIIGFSLMRFHETHGHLPLSKPKSKFDTTSSIEHLSSDEGAPVEVAKAGKGPTTTAAVRAMQP